MSKHLVPWVALICLALGLALRPVQASGVQPNAALELSAAFEETARQVSPSVIQVLSYSRGRRGRWLVSRGSGVILRSQGIAATNHHVVEKADEVAVRFADGTEIDVKVRGVDGETDLAVLELPAGDYPALPLAWESPRVGAWVLAFGNPKGLGTSVTAGIISGHERKLGIATFESFLQTDAAINAGNSGGPLTDLAGRVVGINTARGLGGEDGINFSIPSSMVRHVVDEILAHGTVRRGWLGVRMRELSSRASRERGLPDARHVAVREAIEGGPAAKAGLRNGDVILTIDGEPLRDDRELLDRVAARLPGDKLDLRIDRDGEERTLTVELGGRIAGLAVEQEGTVADD